MSKIGQAALWSPEMAGVLDYLPSKEKGLSKSKPADKNTAFIVTPLFGVIQQSQHG